MVKITKHYKKEYLASMNHGSSEQVEESFISFGIQCFTLNMAVPLPLCKQYHYAIYTNL